MSQPRTLDQELDELEEEMRDIIPGGWYWAHKIRLLCKRGHYVEAMARVLAPPFWWYETDGVTRGDRYEVCGAEFLLHAMIRAARKAELRRAQDSRKAAGGHVDV